MRTYTVPIKFDHWRMLRGIPPQSSLLRTTGATWVCF
jgi:hypothetical protein